MDLFSCFGSFDIVDDMCSDLLSPCALSLETGLDKYHLPEFIFKSFTVVALITECVYDTQSTYENHYLKTGHIFELARFPS